MSQESRITDDAANNDVASRPSRLERIGRWTRIELAAPIPSWAGLVFGVITLIMGLVVGLVINGDNDAQSQAAAPTTVINNHTTVAPAPALVASTPEPMRTSPFKQVAGFGSNRGKEYDCADGLTPVRVVPGQKYSGTDAELTLDETRGRGYFHQEKVTLTVNLAASKSLVGVIVIPTAQANYRTLYNQATRDVVPARKAVITLLPGDFDRLLRDEGIAAVVACVR